MPATEVYAAPTIMPDGGTFDPVYYAQQNPDVATAYGTDPYALYQHYVTCGRNEGRAAYVTADGTPVILPRVSTHQGIIDLSKNTAVVDQNGVLWMCGPGGGGVLGNGSTNNVNVPVPVLDQVVSVSSGETQTAAIRTDGSLWVWGSAPIGDGTEKRSEVPKKIMDQVAQVSCGMGCIAAVKTDGSLWMWGENENGQLGTGVAFDYDAYPGIAYQRLKPVKIMDDVVSVECGSLYNVAAIKKDGSLWMWGNNCLGQLGNGTLDGRDDWGISHPVPQKVMDNVSAVSCGHGTIAAIRTDGSLWMWGDASYGNFGTGAWETALSDHCIVEADGWGGKKSYQTVPLKVMDNVSAVSVWEGLTGIIKADGSLWVCGRNTDGQLGNNRAGNVVLHMGSGYDNVYQTYAVKLMDNVLAVKAGTNFMAAVKTDGTVLVWGDNYYGQLGNGGAGNFVVHAGFDHVIQTTPISFAGLKAKIN